MRPSVKELSLKRQNFVCQIRYRQTPFSCQITQNTQGDIIVIFSNIQRNVTPGQFLALYDAEELIFSGVIAF